MQTGEDTNGLRKIIDLTRGISIAILCFHFYISCYQAFAAWHCTAEITDHLIGNIARTGLFSTLWRPKWEALLLLAVSLIGSKGKKDEKIKLGSILIFLISGLLCYIGSTFLLYLNGSYVAILYMSVCSLGYMLILTGGGRLSRLLKANLNSDIFNKDNETFPQEERLLTNEYSVNLKSLYRLKGKIRKGWINIINPFRGMLVAGTPGAGKSYFVIRHIIEQHLKKGFSMFVYDFKYPDLSVIVYNTLLKYQHVFKIKPSFWVIDFDDIQHQCNPLYPESMTDITDATESSRTIMLGLNREWIKKQGDFFVESAVNFLTAMYEGADGNGDQDRYYKYTHPDDPDHTNEGMFEAVGNDVKFWLAKQNYAFKNSIKQWLSEVLEVIYAASSLCINTLRTFFLIVLAIIGPLVLGFSVFDGLQSSLVQWLARYINVFLWLPVANIFGSIIGKVQEKMLALDIAQIKAQGDTFFSSTDTAYCIFLLIGIVGYFSVPTVAGYIIHAHGGNGMLQRISSLTASGANIVTNTASATGSRMANGVTNIADAPKHFMSGYNSGGNQSYQANKLKGDNK